MSEKSNPIAEILRSKLVQRTGRNPRYSLRRFADALAMSPSALSEILSGKKNLSAERARQIADKLGMDGGEAEQFTLLAALGMSRSKTVRSALAANIAKLSGQMAKREPIEVDQFAMMADWYHIAILQLHDVSSRCTPKLVAKRLGIPEIQAKDGIDRLTRLGLLKKTPAGFSRRTRQRLLIGSSRRNEALCQFHEQMLQKTIDSLVEQGIDDRYNGTETFGLDESLKGDLKTLCNRFLDDVERLASRSKDPRHVFHLGLHMFRISSQERN